MGIIKLTIIEYKENIGKAVILILVSIVVTITGLFWLAQRDLIYGSVDIFRAYGLEGKVLVYGSAFSEEESVIKMETDIESLSCVADAYYCDYYGVFNYLEENINEGSTYWFELYKQPVMINNPYRMIEGRAPEKYNEMMISSNVRGIKVGDHLKNYECSYFGNPEGNQHIEDVLVTGIFDLNNPMPLDLYHTFQGDFESKSDNDEETLQKWGTAFFVSIKDENGEEIRPDTLRPAVIAEPAKGYNASDVVRELSQKLGIESAYDITKFTKHAEATHEDELLLFRTITLVLSVVLLTVNFSYCFIGLYIKKRELAVYHVFGMPWRSTVGLHSFMYLFFVVIGYVIGLLIYIGQAEVIKDIAYNSYYFTPQGAVIVGVVIILVYAVVNLAFYIATCNKTPISLLRRE